MYNTTFTVHLSSRVSALALFSLGGETAMAHNSSQPRYQIFVDPYENPYSLTRLALFSLFLSLQGSVIMGWLWCANEIVHVHPRDCLVRFAPYSIWALIANKTEGKGETCFHSWLLGIKGSRLRTEEERDMRERQRGVRKIDIPSSNVSQLYIHYFRSYCTS